MEGYHLSGTIAACASAHARQAIAVVRLSGPDAWTIAQGCLAEEHQIKPRRANVCTLNLKTTAAQFSDTAVLTCWRAPHSYTGEDMAELSVHGSPVLVRLLLDQCMRLGARLAQAGEFTFRASVHGKLDLAQAEAVQELISAGSERALVLAGNSLAGLASVQVQAWIGKLTQVLAQLEAFHDYAADDLDASIAAEALPTPDTLLASLQQLELELTEAIATSKRLLPWREGITVAILGPPNVGKSTLFNALIGRERALTSPQPGTTRDYLAEALDLCGLKLSLVDTAGYRIAEDSIEAAGVERSAQWGEAADYVLWVSAADGCAVRVPEFLPEARVLQVQTRCDLLPKWPAGSSAGTFYVSGLTGQGIDQLRQHLGAQAGADADTSLASFNRRQLSQLITAQDSLRSAQQALTSALPFDAVSHDLYSARRALTGIYAQDDRNEIISTIFSSFCVGK